MPIPVYHRRGENACGNVAIGVKARHPFSDGSHFPAENVVTIDGRTPLRGETPVCGSCGKIIDSFAELSYEPAYPDTWSGLTRAFIKKVLHHS